MEFRSKDEQVFNDFSVVWLEVDEIEHSPFEMNMSISESSGLKKILRLSKLCCSFKWIRKIYTCSFYWFFQSTSLPSAIDDVRFKKCEHITCMRNFSINISKLQSKMFINKNLNYLRLSSTSLFREYSIACFGSVVTVVVCIFPTGMVIH